MDLYQGKSQLGVKLGQKRIEALMLRCVNIVDRLILLSVADEPDEPSGTPTLEKILAITTTNQSRIMEHLWIHRTASYDKLSTIPGAFQDGPTDEAIEKALKRINERLNLHVEFGVTLEIETAKRRVNLQTVDRQN